MNCSHFKGQNIIEIEYVMRHYLMMRDPSRQASVGVVKAAPKRFCKVKGRDARSETDGEEQG